MHLSFLLFFAVWQFLSLVWWLHISWFSNFISLGLSLRLVFFRKRLKCSPLAFTFYIIFVLHIEYVCFRRPFIHLLLLSLNFSFHSIFLLQMFLTCNLSGASKFFVWVDDLWLAKIDLAFLFGEMVALGFVDGEFFIIRLFVRKYVICLHFNVVSNYLRWLLFLSWVKVCLCLFDFMKNIVFLLKNLFFKWVSLLNLLLFFHLFYFWSRFHTIKIILNLFSLLTYFFDWLI